MNVLFLSIPYIESNVVHSFDIYSGLTVDTLFLFKENHANSNYDTENRTNNYNIELIDSIYSINKDFEIFIYYDSQISDAILMEIIDYSKQNGRIINLIVSKAQFSELQSELHDSTLTKPIFVNEKPFYKDEVTYGQFKKKPIVLICGLSEFNQQVNLELQLCKMFKKNNITFDLLSYNSPVGAGFIDKSLVSNYPDVHERWIDKIKEIALRQNNDANITIISFPFDLLVCSAAQNAVLSQLIRSLKPDYTICCISNERELTDSIDNLELWFHNRFDTTLDAVYVSEYTSNKHEYLKKPYPIQIEYSPQGTSDKVTVANVNTVVAIYDNIISKLSYPTSVRLIQ